MRLSARLLACVLLFAALIGCSDDSKTKLKSQATSTASGSGVSTDGSAGSPDSAGSGATSASDSTDDTSSNAGGSTFVARGNAICKRYQDKANATPSGRSDVKARGAALEKLAGYADQEIGELRGLKPPAAQASTWSSLMDELTRLAGQVHRAASKYKSGDEKGGDLLLGSVETSPVDDTFDKLGMKTCGSGNGDSGSSDTAGPSDQADTSTAS